MASVDKLHYFPVNARAQPTRLLYAIAGAQFENILISFEDWPSKKAEMPAGQLPVLETADGTLNESNVIARYVAKKLGSFFGFDHRLPMSTNPKMAALALVLHATAGGHGLVGNGLWEETLHDLVVENVLEPSNETGKVYGWSLMKKFPEPENPQQVKDDLLARWKTVLELVQKTAEKRGKKFIVGDEIGLAEVWLWSALDFSRLAFPDIVSLTPWTAEFVGRFEADERVQKYLASRPASVMGI